MMFENIQFSGLVGASWVGVLRVMMPGDTRVFYATTAEDDVGLWTARVYLGDSRGEAPVQKVYEELCFKDEAAAKIGACNALHAEAFELGITDAVGSGLPDGILKEGFHAS